MMKQIIAFLKQRVFFVVLAMLFFLPSCVLKQHQKLKAGSEKTVTVVQQINDSEGQDKEAVRFGHLSVDEVRAMKNGTEGTVDKACHIRVPSSSFEYEQGAKWSDIPTCFELVPVVHGSCESSCSVMLSYHSILSQEVVRLFYHTEMERCGWKEHVSFDGHETVMLFVKPKKMAVIIIRPVHKRSWWRRIDYTDVVVYLEK